MAGEATELITGRYLFFKGNGLEIVYLGPFRPCEGTAQGGCYFARACSANAQC